MVLLFLTSMLLVTSSYLFTRLQHPLAMGLTLIMQTLLVCLSSGMMSSFMWMSYILFLVFLGATLVLFIYVASLASNEKFSLSYPMMMITISPLFFLPIIFMKDELLHPLSPSLEQSSLVNSSLLTGPSFDLSMMYNPSSSFLTSFIILYLLLTLIVIVKLTYSSSGPLRLS